MSKPVSNKLYKLIKSLSKGEIKFFKVNTTKNTSNEPVKYQILFDMIRKQNGYNENSLIKKLYSGSDAKNKFRVLKNQLFALLIKNLRYYHEEGSAASEVRVGLETVVVYSKKRLYDEASSLLAKLKEKTERYAIEYLPAIQYWEFRLAHTSRNLPAMKQLTLQGQDKHSSYNTRVLAFSNILNDMSSVFSTLWSKGIIHSKKELDNFKAEISEKFTLLPDEKSFSKYGKLYMRGLCSYIEGDFLSFRNHLKHLLDTIHVECSKNDEYPFFYMTIMNDLALSYHFNKEFELAKQQLELVRANIYKGSNGMSFRSLSNYYGLMLSLNNELGEFDKNLGLLKEIEEAESKYDTEFPAYFKFSYVYTFFGLRDYEKALDWSEEVILSSKKHGRTDSDGIHRLIQIIVVFELGEKYTSLLESLIRSTYRFFLKRSWNFEFETLFLKFVKTSIGFKSKKEVIEGLSFLRKDLEKLSVDESERKILEYFNFDAWLDSKINGISFSEAVKRSFAMETQ